MNKKKSDDYIDGIAAVFLISIIVIGVVSLLLTL